MRDELPRLIPGGELSAVRAPRLRVRTRMLVASLLLGLLPLAVLSMAALTRADALRTADAATAAAIIHNLNLVILVLALGGLVVSVALALLVAASVARPLSEVQAAMAQVQRGGLDARCAVVSNDEIGAGNIGSTERMSYALVGDAVNVASRIQALNKDFGTHMLVSGATRARLLSTVGLESLPAVHVKGRSAEVAVFALR